jgi:hypothetical protein
MHCLYCDRPLALLKRLTGDGEFCSKEHRKIYQQEHNQLALERLLETQPASNKKAGPRKSKTEFVPEIPIPVLEEPVVEEPVERGPERADFLPSPYPEEASPVSALRQLPGDPRFIDLAPVWEATIAGAVFEDQSAPNPQPKGALFQADTFDPRVFDATVRVSSVFGFTFAEGLPTHGLRATISVQPRLRAKTFLDGLVDAKAIPDRIQGTAPEPRWKLLEPAMPRRLSGGIVLVLGSFLRWQVVPAVVEDPLPESFEIRLQPISFPPFSPRMACLEERLHRTDRIGFSPP